MLVAYAAGLRISETVALQIPDIKPDKQLLHDPLGQGAAPNGWSRLPRGVLPIPAQLLAQHLSTTGHLAVLRQLPGHAPSRKQPSPSPSTRHANAPVSTASHTFHCLRHSAATHLHERGGSIDVIQDVLGHRNADTTRRYARATGKMFQTLDHPISGFAVLRA